MRRARMAMTAMILAAGIVWGGAAAPASAGDGSCSSGYTCMWADLSWNGTTVGYSSTWMTFAGTRFANMDAQTTSASANGASCAKSYFYDHGKPSSSKNSFFLWSKSFNPGAHKDSDLRDGVGLPGGQGDWNDRIRSSNFLDCR